MNVKEPSPVSISIAIKRIGIIDRTLPSKDTKPLDDIEKALSLEGVNLDKEGATASIESIKNLLQANNRYTEVVLLTQADVKTTGAGVFPLALDHSIVQKICKQYNLDALVSLEYFDTNSKLDLTVTNTTVSTALGNIPAIQHNASMVTTVQTGWRFYDNLEHKMLDEHRLSRSLTFRSQGANPLTAAKALLDRKEAVKQVATETGKAYGERLLPYWIRVKRDYYLKGNDALKTAARKAQSGNWEGAAELWKKESANPDTKIAGRASYNYAIIHEINGDLDEAIKWAQKSYEDYNERLALSYVRILQDRKQRSERLE